MNNNFEEKNKLIKSIKFKLIHVDIKGLEKSKIRKLNTQEISKIVIAYNFGTQSTVWTAVIFYFL